MIDCKMGISADTLVLVHSSTKVSNQTRHSCFPCVCQSVARRVKKLRAERFSADREANLRCTVHC